MFCPDRTCLVRLTRLMTTATSTTAATSATTTSLFYRLYQHRPINVSTKSLLSWKQKEKRGDSCREKMVTGWQAGCFKEILVSKRGCYDTVVQKAPGAK